MHWEEDQLRSTIQTQTTYSFAKGVNWYPRSARGRRRRGSQDSRAEMMVGDDIPAEITQPNGTLNVTLPSNGIFAVDVIASGTDPLNLLNSSSAHGNRGHKGSIIIGSVLGSVFSLLFLLGGTTFLFIRRRKYLRLKHSPMPNVKITSERWPSLSPPSRPVEEEDSEPISPLFLPSSTNIVDIQVSISERDLEGLEENAMERRNSRFAASTPLRVDTLELQMGGTAGQQARRQATAGDEGPRSYGLSCNEKKAEFQVVHLIRRLHMRKTHQGITIGQFRTGDNDMNLHPAEVRERLANMSESLVKSPATIGNSHHVTLLYPNPPVRVFCTCEAADCIIDEGVDLGILLTSFHKIVTGSFQASTYHAKDIVDSP
ncbi:hypothetical protein EV421DRAFT_2017180 [Armillaria borealis]|uniref:Uncharacterized protein n=1 Tax=Armillaria borealis TaxID=47425 RepID=A0AA39MUW5_9AGAR|nr:hypothetical protein EV421DRAFT_2017180 [Armillaria borealis]